jgi:hypothetical protein
VKRVTWATVALCFRPGQRSANQPYRILGCCGKKNPR